MAVSIQPFSLATGKRSKPLPWSQVTLNPQYNAVGAWSFTAPATADVQALATFGGGGALIPFGLYADWNGIFQMAGIAEGLSVAQAVDTTTGALTRTLTFSGMDALGLLANRLAYITPSADDWQAQSDHSATVGPDAAETVIKTLITDNCISAGDDNRNYPLLDVATDQGRGDSLSWVIRAASSSDSSVVATVADSIMDIWRALAAQLTDPLGLQVTLQGDRLVADCFAPRDLSAHAVFSARLGNLSAAQLDLTNPSANAILQQTGITTPVLNPYLEEDGPAASDPWRRVEAFDDQSSSTSGSDLQASRKDALKAGQQQTQLTTTAADLPRLRFGADDSDAGITGYRLGDTVSVDLLDGLTYADVISAVTLTADKTGDAYAETVVPQIGTATDGTTISAALQRQITALERRIRRARNG